MNDGEKMKPAKPPKPATTEAPIVAQAPGGRAARPAASPNQKPVAPPPIRRVRSWVVSLKSLVPWFTTFEEGENALHWLTIIIVWWMVSILIMLVMWCNTKIHLSALLEWGSALLAVAATTWVSAGVYYVRPSTIPKGDALSEHVVATFAFASRHCMAGLAMSFGALLALVLSKSDWIIALDHP